MNTHLILGQQDGLVDRPCKVRSQGEDQFMARWEDDSADQQEVTASNHTKPWGGEGVGNETAAALWVADARRTMTKTKSNIGFLTVQRASKCMVRCELSIDWQTEMRRNSEITRAKAAPR